jgi:hypothetical protein
MEGFDHGEARRSDGEARMVQLVCCAVALTVEDVIPAMRLYGGARTESVRCTVRKHGQMDADFPTTSFTAVSWAQREQGLNGGCA